MVQVIGRRRHVNRLRRMRARTPSEVEKALFVAGSLIETDARVSITTGAISGAGHVPSLPGEPPNSDTHALDQSIRTRKVGTGVVEVFADRQRNGEPVAVFLEYGTSKMAERPYMRPAAKKNRRKVTALVGRAVRVATGVRFR